MERAEHPEYIFFLKLIISIIIDHCHSEDKNVYLKIYLQQINKSFKELHHVWWIACFSILNVKFNFHQSSKKNIEIIRGPLIKNQYESLLGKKKMLKYGIWPYQGGGRPKPNPYCDLHFFSKNHRAPSTSPNSLRNQTLRWYLCEVLLHTRMSI